MANGTAFFSTTSSTVKDIVTSKENNTDVLSNDLIVAIWRYGLPPLCMMGLVGNTLVLLVLRRDGLVRTSANVYLSALAVGDSLVLMAASVAGFPSYVRGWRLEFTDTMACRATWPVHHALINASTWLIVSFTVERCVVVRFPLLKLRLCTPRNAGLCCVTLLVKNIDVFFIRALIIESDSSDVVCGVLVHNWEYVINCRITNTLFTPCVIPTGVVLVSNWAIIRTLRRKKNSFNVCVLPAYAFGINMPSCPVTIQSQHNTRLTLAFLRYTNHAVNFVLYSVTGVHFR